MNAAWKTGLSFGTTSGVITTLGLLVGLHAGTHSKTAVLGGILTIAVADALSDAMGIHLAEEAKHTQPAHAVWEATLATFVAKFLIAGTFAIPVLVRPLDQAVVISVVWGLALLAAISFFVARVQGISPWKAIGEHLFIALCVVAVTHSLGDWIQGLSEGD
jgi:VIT1/CCC1 family predicted Fe2+/Mn2+ transporter